MPAAFSAIGACSRDEPQPKLRPATMIWYGETNSSSAWKGACPLGRPACAGGTLLSAYLPNCLYSSGIAGLNVRYWAGMIWSVSTLSPRTKALPDMVACMREFPRNSRQVQAPFQDSLDLLQFQHFQNANRRGVKAPVVERFDLE